MSEQAAYPSILAKQVPYPGTLREFLHTRYIELTKTYHVSIHEMVQWGTVNGQAISESVVRNAANPNLVERYRLVKSQYQALIAQYPELTILHSMVDVLYGSLDSFENMNNPNDKRYGIRTIFGLAKLNPQNLRYDDYKTKIMPYVTVTPFYVATTPLACKQLYQAYRLAECGPMLFDGNPLRDPEWFRHWCLMEDEYALEYYARKPQQIPPLKEKYATMQQAVQYIVSSPDFQAMPQTEQASVRGIANLFKMLKQVPGIQHLLLMLDEWTNLPDFIGSLPLKSTEASSLPLPQPR